MVKGLLSTGPTPSSLKKDINAVKLKRQKEKVKRDK